MNSTNNICEEININVQKLKEVSLRKYFGANLSKNGISTSEVRIRIDLATTAIAKLRRLLTIVVLASPPSMGCTCPSSSPSTVRQGDLDT
ncbi:hypothetical protein DPMN_091598 [Dreissena polymorpha]|uniref:Uncharacterized protein n=1 Tax=Dreissena polymorpha TaxID=45954 RepID=A0A9D4KZT4_DREPO|nr:hypothetical protein DPMN_091598 [Dreissena polymorpha]